MVSSCGKSVSLAGDEAEAWNFPRGQGAKQLAVGEIESERCHSDQSLVNGMYVGAGRLAGGGEGSADPVIGVAAWVGATVHVVTVHALAEAGDLVGGLAVGRGRLFGAGDVDAEQGAGRQRSPAGDKRAAEAHRHGNCGDTAHGCFDGGSNGARIEDVAAQVVAVVDAGDDEVGAFAELEQAEVGAIGGSATDRPDAGADFLDAQRVKQGERVRGCAALAIGREDVDIGYLGERAGED